MQSVVATLLLAAGCLAAPQVTNHFEHIVQCTHV